MGGKKTSLSYDFSTEEEKNQKDSSNEIKTFLLGTERNLTLWKSFQSKVYILQYLPQIKVLI